ncbi:hypothetical protein [Streptomyces aureus]
MSDDERPDNVLTLPRIGSAPPPDLPPAPDLSAPAPADPGEGGGVRISPWDAPDIPHAPAAPDGAAVLRSEGADPPGTPDAGAPRAGALSLAAILAIALAAFEGMQTWVKEAVPLRAEAARHRRELELLAAKANADAHRLGAEASGVRRRGVPSGHDYGRSVLGSGSGGRGRGGAGTSGRGNSSGGIGTGPGVRPGSGRGSTPMGSHTGSGRTNGPGRGGGSGNGSSGSGSGRGTFGGSGNSSRSSGSGNSTRGGAGSGNGSRGGAGSGGGASGSSGALGGNTGRRSAGRKIADWWSKGKQNSDTGGPSSGGGSGGAHSAATKGAVRNAVKAAKGGPTFWDATGDKPSARWKDRTGPVDGGSGRAAGTGPGPVNTGWTPGGRTTFWQAVHETIDGRWNKRRADWKASGGPRRQRTGPRKPSAPDPSSTGADAKGPSGDPNASGDGAWRWARASAFDTGDGPITVTVEQAGPARGHGTRWEPTPIAPARPQLPRAPQRPAGTRPGTTHRRDFPMPPATSGSVQVTAPPANAMAGRHATEITLDGAVSALTRLTMAGMETYDDAQALAKQARRLLSELEAMGNDLAVTHNVLGPRTVRSFAVLMESVGMLVVTATRTAKSALAAAELAEAEEAAMERDYRPTQMAAVDAGLAAPSARIHNEN